VAAGSWGGRRLSLADYVRLSGPRIGRLPPEVQSCLRSYRTWRVALLVERLRPGRAARLIRIRTNPAQSEGAVTSTPSRLCVENGAP